MAPPAWDATAGRVGNASQYLIDQLDSIKATGELRWPAVGGFTKLFEVTQKWQIPNLVRIVDAANPNSATIAAQHLQPANGSVAAAAIGATSLPKKTITKNTD